jgi:hypothetical protein
MGSIAKDLFIQGSYELFTEPARRDIPITEAEYEAEREEIRQIVEASQNEEQAPAAAAGAAAAGAGAGGGVNNNRKIRALLGVIYNILNSNNMDIEEDMERLFDILDTKVNLNQRINTNNDTVLTYLVAAYEVLGDMNKDESADLTNYTIRADRLRLLNETLADETFNMTLQNNNGISFFKIVSGTDDKRKESTKHLLSPAIVHIYRTRLQTRKNRFILWRMTANQQRRHTPGGYVMPEVQNQGQGGRGRKNAKKTKKVRGRKGGKTRVRKTKRR